MASTISHPVIVKRTEQDLAEKLHFAILNISDGAGFCMIVVAFEKPTFMHLNMQTVCIIVYNLQVFLRLSSEL